MKTKHLLSVLSLIAFFAACKKSDTPAQETPEVTKGIYILNEGGIGKNNTTLTYYSFTTHTATTDFYQNVNGQGLGDTGSDILIYGGKMYIVVNVSSYVRVVDASNAKIIKEIPFEISAGGAKREPRYAVAYKNKVLVSSYDGTVAVIDTSALTVDKWVTVGTNPEELVVVGDKLYVANSGGLNYPEYDSTLSVVDLATMTETQKIKVGTNPGSITADTDGNLYVACTGNYGDIKPSLVKVSSTTNTVVSSADTTVAKIRFANGLLYTTGGYLGSPFVRTLNTTDFSATRPNFVTDGTAITKPYGVNIDPETGDVYVTDAKDYTTPGEVFCFDKAGKKKFSFSVSPGINPNKVLLVKQ